MNKSVISIISLSMISLCGADSSSANKSFQNEDIVFSQWVKKINSIYSYSIENFGKSTKEDFIRQFGKGAIPMPNSSSTSSLQYTCFQDEGAPDMAMPSHIPFTVTLEFHEKTGKLCCIRIDG